MDEPDGSDFRFIGSRGGRRPQRTSECRFLPRPGTVTNRVDRHYRALGLLGKNADVNRKELKLEPRHLVSYFCCLPHDSATHDSANSFNGPTEEAAES